MLCQAADHADLSLDTDGEPRDRPPLPLHFVLLFADGDLGRLVEGLRAGKGLIVEHAERRLLISAVAGWF